VEKLAFKNLGRGCRRSGREMKSIGGNGHPHEDHPIEAEESEA
jgi:hypothetical protein